MRGYGILGVMENWKKAFIIFLTWTCILILGRHFETNAVIEIPKPFKPSVFKRSNYSKENFVEKNIMSTNITMRPNKSDLIKEIPNVKKILFYTPFFSMKDWGFGFGQKPFERCPVSNCLTTNDRSYLKSISGFLQSWTFRALICLPCPGSCQLGCSCTHIF